MQRDLMLRSGTCLTLYRVNGKWKGSMRAPANPVPDCDAEIDAVQFGVDVVPGEHGVEAEGLDPHDLIDRMAVELRAKFDIRPEGETTGKHQQTRVVSIETLDCRDERRRRHVIRRITADKITWQHGELPNVRYGVTYLRTRSGEHVEQDAEDPRRFVIHFRSGGQLPVYDSGR